MYYGPVYALIPQSFPHLGAPMTIHALLALLADGEIHSGQSIASALGVSRTAVWKQIKRVQAEGYEVEKIRGHGYRLVKSIDFQKHKN